MRGGIYLRSRTHHKRGADGLSNSGIAYAYVILINSPESGENLKYLEAGRVRFGLGPKAGNPSRLAIKIGFQV